MTPQVLSLLIRTLIVMALFTCSAALCQIADTTTTTLSAGASNDGSASPDIPSPTNSQAQSQPHILIYAKAKAQVTVLEDTTIRVMTIQPVSSRQSRDGTPVLFTLSDDVIVDNEIVIPRGVIVHGEVIQTKKAGALTGSPELTLKLISLDLGDRSYPLYTYQFKVQGTSKTKPTETKVKGGAVIGAIVGGVFSGSAKGENTAVGKLAGMGTGAALGAGVGAMASAATPRPILSIPAESQMEFQLASPISVQTVTVEEAIRVTQRLRPGDPVLYVRGTTP